MTYNCPSCGHDVSIQWMFCHHCYVPLGFYRNQIQTDRERTARYLMEQLSKIGINPELVGWNEAKG